MESLGLTRQFAGAYRGARVLVTGHTGFKGSWLCLWLRALGAEVAGIALAPDTTPSHWRLLALDDVEDLPLDIRDGAALAAAVARLRPQVVFHLAAQPLVRRSYAAPTETFATNVTGLVNLYEALRGIDGVQAVVNATTDKVYLDQSVDPGYNEDHPLGGHDPYSTSKACAELVSECYRKSFFSGVDPRAPRLATARAGNVIGGGDWAEDRLVPDLVRAAAANIPLRLRNPEAIRPWQHVLEPLSGYLRLGQALLAGEAAEGAWNFGPSPDSNLPVSELASRLQSRWPAVTIEADPGPHPHEAATLRLDCGKAERGLRWRPVWNAETTIARTIDWYRAFYERRQLSSLADLRAYADAAADAGLAWATGA